MSIPPVSISNSDIKVVNAALAKLGHKPISSLTETSLAGRSANLLYADALESALSDYPWRFARDRRVMARAASPAPAPWQSLWTLPNGTLTVLSVWEGDQKTLHDVFGRNVATMTDAGSTDQVLAEITAFVGPSQWPGYFRDGFTSLLAGILAMPVTQSELLAQQWTADGANKLMRARSRDAQSRSPSRIDTKMFIRARRSGGRLR